MTSYAVCRVFGACLVPLMLTTQSIAAQKPDSVTNFRNGETIRYSTPLIMGTLADDKAEKITLVNESSRRPTRQLSGLARKGRFKVLADLVPGENKLVLSAGGRKVLSLTLTFKPQTNPYTVRAIYYVNKTGDKGYDSPVKDDKQDVAAKISTAMLLMQSFSAERMNDMGYGRKTFNVELQEDGTVKVFIIQGKQDPDSSFNSGAIGEAIGSQAQGSSTTHYLVILGRKCGYVAIGGPPVAYFGGACIYSWPDSIRDAQAAFMDATPIDSGKYPVDAIGRDTFWANSSTCIGACLHEMLHSFCLPHSMDGLCIMTRGHDYFNRFFTLVEPPSKQNPNMCEFDDSEASRFCRVTANNLAYQSFFQLDTPVKTGKPAPAIAYDKEKNEITVTSAAGIGFVGLEVPYANPGADYCLALDPQKPAPHKLVIPSREWERFGGGQFQVRVIDIEDQGACDRDPLKGNYGKK